MKDDLFDVDGGPNGDNQDSASESSNQTTEDENNSDPSNDITTGNPTEDPAFSAEYRDHQHTVTMLDNTWDNYENILEDAIAYCQLDGFSNVSKFEANEAIAQLIIEDAGAETVAEKIKQMRYDAHE